MTIDEQFELLMKQLPYLSKTDGGVQGFREALATALRQVARDQRHACAMAIAAIDRNAWSKDAAMQSVMNAIL